MLLVVDKADRSFVPVSGERTGTPDTRWKNTEPE
jgi:hypothetical protein